MKKLLLSLLGVLMALPVLSRDFTYTHEGQTLTYTVLDEAAKTCETKAGNLTSSLSNGNTVSGDLVIPAVAKDGEIEYTVVAIGNKSFYNEGEQKVGPTSVVIPNTVTRIGEWAFNACELLESVEIPESVNIIGEGAFSYATGLLEVKIPEGISEIKRCTFRACYKLSSVNIPATVTSIGEEAFLGNYALASIEIPNSVSTIGYSAFRFCSALSSVRIGTGLTKMDYGVFSACEKLSDVTILAKVPPTINTTFGTYTATLHVPAGSLAAYRNADCWKNFNNIMADASGIEDVMADGANGAPVEVYNLSGVKVGNSVDGLLPGVYIVRQGKTVSKIFVR